MGARTCSASEEIPFYHAQEKMNSTKHLMKRFPFVHTSKSTFLQSIHPPPSNVDMCIVSLGANSDGHSKVGITAGREAVGGAMT